jgi:hypothetical protein
MQDAKPLRKATILLPYYWSSAVVGVHFHAHGNVSQGTGGVSIPYALAKFT